ncbi:hypothetical protein IF1G_11437 [Cordyceps javanica]|uniref:Uncharacterized protein n=1 Tax=Cordyceps javanica TaxID=43265 RepID=A0A545UKA5_9HYPO|nr:hypothetical protein IF1G_11437 [Cordyceps javanica]
MAGAGKHDADRRRSQRRHARMGTCLRRILCVLPVCIHILPAVTTLKRPYVPAGLEPPNCDEVPSR